MENRLIPDWLLKSLGIVLIILLILLSLNQIKLLGGHTEIMKITGMGKINGVPDLATVTIGVVAQGNTAVEVENNSNQKINQIINFLQEQGVDKKDITTTAFYANPRYNYVNGNSNIIGYQAEQSITVKVYDVDKSTTKLSKILSGAISNGANQIQGIYFDFKDPEKLKEQARIAAIKNAKDRAQLLADETNLNLGKIINVLESTESYPQPQFFGANNFAAKAQVISPKIEPGNQELTETITLLFEVS